MKQRLDAVGRVLAVQRSLQRMAEWKLAELDRQAAAIGETQRQLAELMDSELPLSGLLLTAVVRRRRSLAERAAHIDSAKTAQTKVAVRETGRAKLAERVFETVAKAHRRMQENAELAELIDRAVGRKDASLP